MPAIGSDARRASGLLCRVVDPMSEFLSANLTLLRATNPALVPAPSDRVRAGDAGWRLFPPERPEGVTIHSRDPQREADRVVATLLDGVDAEIVVVLGLGLGFMLDALDRRAWAGRVLAIEPFPETIQPLLERREWQTWLTQERLRILTGPDFTDRGDTWRWFGDGSVPVVTYIHPVMAELRPESVASAKQALDRIRFDAKANADARREFAPRYLTNTLRNLSAIASESDVARLTGAAAGLPAIVVAAGPSLDRAIPVLRTLQHSAVIVCVDTALRVLLAGGVTPHAVVAVDPTEANARHLTDLPNASSTHLIVEGSIDPVVPPGFSGRTFFATVSNHEPWPWLAQHHYRAGHVRAWGSVLTTAYDVAVQMHCDPIVFVGADLAYTDGRPYARGVVFEEDWRAGEAWATPLEQQWAESLNRHEPIYVTDVTGRQVRTAAHLVAFRDWLLQQFAADGERRHLNATGGGILQGMGIEQIALEQLESLAGRWPVVGRDVVASCYAPSVAPQIIDVARQLRSAIDAHESEATAILERWQAFAPGVTRNDVLQALEAAVPSSQLPDAPLPAPALGSGQFAENWLFPLTLHIQLVPMVMPRHRMRAGDGGRRVFHFRTMTARLIGCVLHPSEGGVTEDGRALRRVESLDDLAPGTYSICRDEVHFRATDGSDARINGRTYAVMVPPGVHELEQRPLSEILERRL